MNRELMYIFGGCDGNSEFADLYQYHCRMLFYFE